MVLIASIRYHSMSDTRAVVFHNSYATGTDKLVITNHKNDNAFASQRRHIRQGVMSTDVSQFTSLLQLHVNSFR